MYKPTYDRIIVKPIVVENEKTEGGLFIPVTAQEKPQTGEVIAVGPGRKTENGTYIHVPFDVGQKVLYGKYSGTEIKIEKENYLIMEAKDILAVI